MFGLYAQEKKELFEARECQDPMCLLEISPDNREGKGVEGHKWGRENGGGCPLFIFSKSTGTEILHKPTPSELPPSCPPAPGISSGPPVRERVEPSHQERRERDTSGWQAVGKARPEGQCKGLGREKTSFGRHPQSDAGGEWRLASDPTGTQLHAPASHFPHPNGEQVFWGLPQIENFQEGTIET